MIILRRPKLIAFTFDDGPSPYTGMLLDGLRDRGAAATFFMTGENGTGGTCGIKNGYETLLARMWEEGHQLANHTCRHADFQSLTEEEIASETAGVERLIFEAAGGDFRCFVRTPGGVVNETVSRSVNAPIIRWSVDPTDWKHRDAELVYNSLLSHAKDRSIVLLHDIYVTSVEAALRAIDTLGKQGFTFVTVADLLRRTGVRPVNGTVYSKGGEKRFPLPAYRTPHVVLKKRNTLKITCSVPPGLSLYYTTDGSYPRLSSHQYDGPVIVEQGTVFTVIGVDEWGTRTPPAVIRAGKDKGWFFNR